MMKLVDNKGECIVHFYKGAGYVEHGDPLKTYEIYINEDRYYRPLKLVYDFTENDFSLYDINTELLVWIELLRTRS